jgi:hypothetical protein
MRRSSVAPSKPKVDMSAWPEVEDPDIIFTGPSPRGWHRLQQAAECLQRYAWGYENGPKEDISKKPPLAIGSLIHLSLAQHYAKMKEEQEGRNPNEFMDPVEAVRLVAEVQGNEKHVPNVVQTYEDYRRRYWQDINQRRIVAVEVLYDGTLDPTPEEAKAGEPSYRLTGRLDLMFEDMGGRLIASDHKSTGRLKKAHKDYFAVSGQMLGYAHIVRQKHPDLASFEINLIQHAGQGETKFQRIFLPRRPALEAQFVARARDIEKSIERMQAEGRPVDQWPKVMSELGCYHRYGACDHIDKCMYGALAQKGGSWEWED